MTQAMFALRAINAATTHKNTWPALPPILDRLTARVLQAILLDGAVEANACIPELASMWTMLDGTGPIGAFATLCRKHIMGVLKPQLTIGKHPFYCIGPDWPSPFPTQTPADSVRIAQSIQDAATLNNIVLKQPPDPKIKTVPRTVLEIISEAAQKSKQIDVDNSKSLLSLTLGELFMD